MEQQDGSEVGGDERLAQHLPHGVHTLAREFLMHRSYHRFPPRSRSL